MAISPLTFRDPTGLCPQDPNKQLADCYKNALDAYDGADPGAAVRFFKYIAPTNPLVGATVGAANEQRMLRFNSSLIGAHRESVSESGRV